MAKTFIDKLRDGDSLDDVFLAAEKQLRINKNGNPYVQIELRDRSGGMSARMWNAGDVIFRSFENGDFLHVDGKVQNFQGSLQIVLSHFEKVESKSIDLADFMPTTEHDIAALESKLGSFLRKLSSPHLRALGELFLGDEETMTAFSACPAGVKLHHAYIGGLLEHTVTMMEIADLLVPFYPGTDRDLVIMGLFLHDLGKTRELTFQRAFGYRDEGQLVGHIVQGVEMLNDMAVKVPELMGESLPRELLVRLKHVVLSHHGTHENGSPKVPMTPEAMLVHLIDTMDTRMHMMLRELKDDRLNATAWTPYNHNLGRRIYKGGDHGELYGAGSENYL